MARIEFEGEPSGRSEDEIRANIPNIPEMLMLSAHTSPEVRARLQEIWWEEIALQQKDLDEIAAHRENEVRNRAV